MIKTLLVNQETMILKHMKTLKKLPLTKEMVTQLVVYQIIFILKKIIR